MTFWNPRETRFWNVFNRPRFISDPSHTTPVSSSSSCLKWTFDSWKLCLIAAHLITPVLTPFLFLAIFTQQCRNNKSIQADNRNGISNGSTPSSHVFNILINSQWLLLLQSLLALYRLFFSPLSGINGNNLINPLLGWQLEFPMPAHPLSSKVTHHTL